jgi:hypothetical protein
LISTPTTIEQIDAWRAAKSETENLEFKEAKNQFDFETLLSYCVAIANERGGILILGIANRPPRPVVGTKACSIVAKTTEDILNKLHFRVDVEEVQHPDGRVVVFHIPSRPIGHPYQLDGSFLMRAGEALVPMTSDQLKKIIHEGGSDRRGAIVASVVILVLVLGVLGWLKYQSLTHMPGLSDVERSPSETHPTSGNATAVVKHPEQQPNPESHNATDKPTQPPNSGKLTKPSARPNAKLQFSFWPVGADQRLTDTVSMPLVNGVVSVVFTAKDVGNAQADNGQLWIQICDECRFAEEPEGTTMPPGDPTVRRKRFDILHMGSYFEATTLRIVPPSGVTSFTIALKYSCERCPPVDNQNPKKLRVNLN